MTTAITSRKVVRAAVAAPFALGLLAAAPARAQVTVVPDTSRVIRTTGHASIEVAPDMATVTLGVWVGDADAKRAKTAVDATVAKIVALARSLKVADGDLKTAAVNIAPRYDMENPTRFRGYDVTRSVTIVLRQIDSLDPLLDGAVQAGANRDFEVDLSTSKEEELKREAVTKALANARTQANTAAEQMGVRVTGVRSIDLEGASRQGLVQTSRSLAVSSGPAPARFLPGSITVTADIPVVFTIEDRK